MLFLIKIILITLIVIPVTFAITPQKIISGHDEMVEARRFKGDFSFVLKHTGFEKLIGNSTLKNLVFHVSCPAILAADNCKIKMKGVPTKFEKKTEAILEIIRPRIDFIYPRPLGESLVGYRYELEKLEGGGYFITAVDDSNANVNQRYFMYFSGNFSLTKLLAFSAVGTTIVHYDHLGDGHLKEMKVETYDSSHKTTFIYQFSYQKTGNYSFVRTVQVKSFQEVMGNVSIKGKKVSNEVHYQLIFDMVRVK